MRKEVMNWEESKKGYMGAFWGKKGKGEIELLSEKINSKYF